MAVSNPSPSRRRRRRLHRTWKQRLVFIAGATTVSLCVLSACAVWYVQSWYSGIHRIKIVHASTVPPDPTETPGVAAGITATTAPDLGSSKTMNVLLTGSDGRSCIDPKSPYAGAFLGDGTNIGSRSDTIIVAHIDPARKQLGLLSFPRDLWVTIAGTTRKDKINAAFNPNDPNLLIQTIESNFGVRIDHYIGVDFCAFKSMVDAVGGISIPFTYPTRDLHTGLNVQNPGCHAMSGDEALAYVRSRYYEYEVNGKWVTDGTSDYGRIARQQDFIRRLAAVALGKGVTNPLTAKHLLDAARSSDVHIDDGLSLPDMIRLANSVRDLGLENAVSYRLEGQGQVVGGADVIVPDLTSTTSKAILSFFRGAEAPATDTSPAASGTATAAPTTSSSAVAVTTVPGAATASAGATNNRGVFPPADVSCL